MSNYLINQINKSNNLLIMGDFNAKHVNLGSEGANHYGTKLMGILKITTIQGMTVSDTKWIL